MIWLQRNDSAHDATNNTPSDAWRNYLQRQIGGTGTDGTRDLERIWLMSRIASLGGSSTNLSITELWTTYLNLKNINGTSLDELFSNWIDHGTV